MIGRIAAVLIPGVIAACTRILQRWEDSQSNLAVAFNNRGLAYANLGQNDKAIADLDQAIDFDPQMATAYLNRGAAYESKGEHERGIADYSRAISLDPQLKVAYFNRGAIYESQGEHDRAIADFDKAIRLDPNDADTYNRRGIAFDNRGGPGPRPCRLRPGDPVESGPCRRPSQSRLLCEGRV
jgi:tetratricopeptide (TPR) repeat protein